jgi:membrane-associated protein
MMHLVAMFGQFEDWVNSDWSYLVIFGVAMLDAFFPLVPSETVAITGGVLASAGDLSLPLVIVTASAGAIVGDSISYWIGHTLGEHSVKRLFRGERSHKAFEWAERQLEERGTYLIIIARFIPGGRTATTFSAGYVHTFAYRRFLAADIVAGCLWGLYTGLLGYIGGKQFESQPWKGLVVAFAIAVGIAATVEGVRHFRARAERQRAAADLTPVSDSDSEAR